MFWEELWKKKFILFDLDGTLTDPKAGITKSVQYALKSRGVIVENADELLPFIGPPLRDSFKKYYNLDDKGAEEAVAKYREYFSEKGIYENAVYDGIPEMLQALQSLQTILILATSKPTVYAKRILEHFGLQRYFTFVSGSELNGERSKKSEIIQYAFDNLDISALDEAVMIGDREHDIIGAREKGIDSVGVLYGYGDYGELKEAGATYVVENVNVLKKLLCKH